MIGGCLLTLLLLPPLAAGPALAGQPADRLVVDDFEASKEGAFPEGWALKTEFWDSCHRKEKVFSVKSEKGNKYLAAESTDDSCTAGRQFPYDLSVYRFISWRWRARALPKGGNEAAKGTNDSAAGLYVCFKGFARLPYCIKYVWSSMAPEGEVFPSPYRKATKIMVLRSGPDKLGTWVEENRNLYEDYLRVFGGKTVKNPVGIAVLTDSDNTHSYAAADYDDIAVSRD
jgi:hypothetical protein